MKRTCQWLRRPHQRRNIVFETAGEPLWLTEPPDIPGKESRSHVGFTYHPARFASRAGLEMRLQELNLLHATRESRLQTFRTYYTTQYDRVNQHETHRLQLSSFVMAGTAAALALVAPGKTAVAGETGRASVSAALALINVFAIFYAFRAAYWTRIHLTRTDAALVSMSRELAPLQVEADRLAGRDPSTGHSTRAHWFQSAIHALLAILSVVVAVVS